MKDGSRGCLSLENARIPWTSVWGPLIIAVHSCWLLTHHELESDWGLDSAQGVVVEVVFGGRKVLVGHALDDRPRL